MKTSRTENIDSYVVTYFGGAKRAKRSYKYRATVALHNTTKRFATLYFHCDESTLPMSDELSDTGAWGCHFLVNDLPNILDLLRNEKPVFFHKPDEWPTMGVISTDKEPVGEGE